MLLKGAYRFGRPLFNALALAETAAITLAAAFLADEGGGATLRAEIAQVGALHLMNRQRQLLVGDHRHLRQNLHGISSKSASLSSRYSCNTCAMPSGRLRTRDRPKPIERSPPIPSSWRMISLHAITRLTVEARRKIQRNQPPQRLGHRSRIRAGLGRVQEEFKGVALAFAVLVDRDICRAKRRLHPVRLAVETARTWLFRPR